MLAVAVALAGWQGWNWWQRSQSSQASAIYFGLQKAVMEGDAKRARELAGEIIDRYPRTAYSGLGALLSAKLQVDKGEAENAKVQLQWAAEHATDNALRALARLRLATLLFDEKSYDDALKQLAAEPMEAFAPRFAELKGDVLATQGKAADARAAYQLALSQLDKTGSEDGVRGAYREMLQTKLDSLGAAK
jgi:predicted negative regulator of RcsB-dependent stress response